MSSHCSSASRPASQQITFLLQNPSEEHVKLLLYNLHINIT